MSLDSGYGQDRRIEGIPVIVIVVGAREEDQDRIIVYQGQGELRVRYALEI